MSWKSKVVGCGELLWTKWKSGVYETVTSTTSQCMAKGTDQRARHPFRQSTWDLQTCPEEEKTKPLQLTKQFRRQDS